MTYIGWREKARIILDVVTKMQEYVEEWVASETTNEHDEIVVKKKAALEVLGYSNLVEKLACIETKKDIEKVIRYINDQIEAKTSTGYGWDADVWEKVNTILGHHL